MREQIEIQGSDDCAAEVSDGAIANFMRERKGLSWKGGVAQGSTKGGNSLVCFQADLVQS